MSYVVPFKVPQDQTQVSEQNHMTNTDVTPCALHSTTSCSPGSSASGLSPLWTTHHWLEAPSLTSRHLLMLGLKNRSQIGYAGTLAYLRHHYAEGKSSVRPGHVFSVFKCRQQGIIQKLTLYPLKLCFRESWIYIWNVDINNTHYSDHIFYCKITLTYIIHLL